MLREWTGGATVHPNHSLCYFPSQGVPLCCGVHLYPACRLLHIAVSCFTTWSPPSWSGIYPEASLPQGNMSPTWTMLGQLQATFHPCSLMLQSSSWLAMAVRWSFWAMRVPASPPLHGSWPSVFWRSIMVACLSALFPAPPVTPSQSACHCTLSSSSTRQANCAVFYSAA